QFALWNATATEYPQDACIHELFAAQAARAPGAVAIVFNGRTRDEGRTTSDERPTTNGGAPSSIVHRPSSHTQHLSYGELNARANRLAHHLRGLGVGPDVRVGICIERSPELLIGLLGTLKAGGAYVPLDPTYPAERLAFM